MSILNSRFITKFCFQIKLFEDSDKASVLSRKIYVSGFNFNKHIPTV